MKNFNKTIITFTTAELQKLNEADHSCVEKEEQRLHLTLLPFHLTNIFASINEILSSNITKYNKDLHGILLGYQNVKILDSTPAIYNDNCLVHINVNADFYLFKPLEGKTLVGLVNQISDDHIGCIVHKAFNIVVPKVKGKDWHGKSVEKNQHILVCVTYTNLEGKLPYIKAEFLSIVSDTDSGISTGEEAHFDTNQVMDSTELPTKNKKLHKKSKKHETFEDSEDTNLTTFEICDETINSSNDLSYSHKKKKKKRKQENQEQQTEEIDIGQQPVKKRKKSSDFEKDLPTFSTKEQEIFENNEIIEELPKIKKKKKKSKLSDIGSTDKLVSNKKEYEEQLEKEENVFEEPEKTGKKRSSCSNKEEQIVHEIKPHKSKKRDSINFRSNLEEETLKTIDKPKKIKILQDIIIVPEKTIKDYTSKMKGSYTEQSLNEIKQEAFKNALENVVDSKSKHEESVLEKSKKKKKHKKSKEETANFYSLCDDKNSKKSTKSQISDMKHATLAHVIASIEEDSNVDKKKKKKHKKDLNVEDLRSKALQKVLGNMDDDETTYSLTKVKRKKKKKNVDDDSFNIEEIKHDLLSHLYEENEGEEILTKDKGKSKKNKKKSKKGEKHNLGEDSIIVIEDTTLDGYVKHKKEKKKRKKSR